MLDDDRVKEIKDKYSKGTTIVLTHDLDDPQPIPKGAKGKVDFVDDIGSIHIIWDSGRTLALIPDVDKFDIVGDEGEV